MKAEQQRASLSSVRLSPSSEIDSGFDEWPGCKKVHATLTNNMWHVRTLDGDALISLHDMVWYLRSPGTLTRIDEISLPGVASLPPQRVLDLLRTAKLILFGIDTHRSLPPRRSCPGPSPQQGGGCMCSLQRGTYCGCRRGGECHGAQAAPFETTAASRRQFEATARPGSLLGLDSRGRRGRQRWHRPS